MAQIAGLSDFRGQGAPADLGTFVMPCSVVVYQARFGGTTYVCAARQGERGWVLVGYLALTGANATAVINAALAALTAGRTWKETVVVIGNYVDLGTINLPSYLLLMIFGSWRLENNHVGSWLVNAAGVAGNVWIEVCGGKLDGNQGNQVSGGNVINFRMSDDCWVHHMEIICAFRTSASAEGVYEGTGVQFAGNGAGAPGSYRGIVAHCRIRNMYKDGVQYERAPNGIVYSCTFLTTVSGAWETSAVQFAYASDNGVCFGCSCDVGNLATTRGYKNHGCSNCIFAFNTAKNARLIGIWIASYDYAVNDNIVMGNRVIGPGLQGTGIIITGPISSYRNLIMGNTVNGHTVGITSDGSSAIMYRSLIISNTVRGVNNSAENGIRLIAAWGGVVQGNTVETVGTVGAGNSSSAAIRLSGDCDYCFVKGNSIFECPFALRTDTSPYPSYCVWVDNHCTYTPAGFSTFFNMNGGSYHIVARNVAMHYGSYGVALDVAIDYVWIYNNDFIAIGDDVLHRISAGTHIYVYFNSGYITENVLLSGTFTIDAVGLKTITVAHGLGDVPHAYKYTPQKEDFSIAVIENTAVDDWRYDLLKVSSVTDTNVVIKINVNVSSATAGATAKIGIHVFTGLPNRAGGL